MKKLFLFAAFIVSYCLSAQTDGLYIQNYKDVIIEYTIWKSNYSTTTGNCSPNIQANTALSVLGPASSAGGVFEAFYNEDVNKASTFNPVYPNTPLINSWVVNADYLNPYNLPGNPVPSALWTASKWAGMKFGVKDTSGVAIGGYYTMHLGCGAANPPVTDLSGYGTPVVDGAMFTLGGSTWVVIF